MRLLRGDDVGQLLWLLVVFLNTVLDVGPLLVVVDFAVPRITSLFLLFRIPQTFVPVLCARRALGSLAGASRFPSAAC
jgi:hypothetical protein